MRGARERIAKFRAIRMIARNELLTNIIETRDWDKLKHCLGVFDAETEKLIKDYCQRVGETE